MFYNILSWLVNEPLPSCLWMPRLRIRRNSVPNYIKKKSKIWAPNGRAIFGAQILVQTRLFGVVAGSSSLLSGSSHLLSGSSQLLTGNLLSGSSHLLVEEVAHLLHSVKYEIPVNAISNIRSIATGKHCLQMCSEYFKM